MFPKNPVVTAAHMSPSFRYIIPHLYSSDAPLLLSEELRIKGTVEHLIQSLFH